MRKINSKIFLAALLVNTITFSNTWAERIVINDAKQTVTVTQPLDCYSIAEITVNSSQPEIYEPESNRLQVLGDTVRAILNYECPELSEIRITGLVRGLDEIIYQGNLSERNNWRVQAKTTALLNQHQHYAGSNYDQTNLRTTLQNKNSLNKQLAITGIHLGMTVKEVSARIVETFHIEPEYDMGTGLMTLRTSGCPTEFDASHDPFAVQAEWICLKARFSDQRIARLDHLKLVQVAKTNTDKVQQLLVEKYGTPDEFKIAHFDLKTQLLWHTAIDNPAKNHLTHSLIATLSETGENSVITDLTLSVQAVNKDNLMSYADTGLRL